MKKQYYIKETADLTGVSKDTLRIYEKNGLLMPRRDENGFRTYSESDIYRMIGILFRRAVLLPIKTVRHLMQISDHATMREVIDQKIEEEKRLMAFHATNIRRLELSKDFYPPEESEVCCRVRSGTGRILSEPRADFMDTVRCYFSEAKKDGDLALCYLHAEYDLRQSKEQPVRTYLMMREAQIAQLGRTEDWKQRGEEIPQADCLRLCIYAETPVPGRAELEALEDRARSMNLRLTGIVHGHFLYPHETEKGISYYLELEAPIASG